MNLPGRYNKCKCVDSVYGDLPLVDLRFDTRLFSTYNVRRI